MSSFLDKNMKININKKIIILFSLFAVGLVLSLIGILFFNSIKMSSNITFPNKYTGVGFQVQYPEDIQVDDIQPNTVTFYKEDVGSVTVSMELGDIGKFKETFRSGDCSAILNDIVTLIVGSPVEVVSYATVDIAGIKTCEIVLPGFIAGDESDNIKINIGIDSNDNLVGFFYVFVKDVNTEEKEKFYQIAQTFKSGNFEKSEDPNRKPVLLSNEELENRKSIIQTDKGNIEIELFAQEAPLTVSNHITLSKEGFYNGLTFHRREEGFVIQGGDPLGNGRGGPGYKFQDEPVTRNYDRGIVAMANSGPNTNGSQFFIMLADVELPPSYTIFGKVTSGMDVVDKIQVGDKILGIEIK